MTDNPDPVAEPNQAPQAVEPVKAAKPRTSAVPLVLGGVIAAALGFGLAQVIPQGWPLTQVSGLTAQIAAQIAAQSQAIAGLQSKLADLANAPIAKPDPALGDRLATVEASVAALPKPVDVAPLTQRLDAIESQLAGLSTAPGATGTFDGAALAQLRSEVAALKSGGPALDAKMAEATAQLDGIKAEAQAVVKAAAGRAALHQIQAALDSGAAYGSALADLPTTDLPEILTTHAQSGMPSLQALRATFPQAARAALDAALRAASGESWTDRVSTFLRGQTGARSLTPHTGTDADAVLSRAEAAMVQGDLTAALAELDGLPDPGKAAMADWLALAKQRQDAVAAVQALTASLGQ